MPTETTPLITTVRVGPPRRRYPHNVLRRFCTIALSSTLIWFMLAFIVTLTVSPRLGGPHRHHHHPPYRHHHPGDGSWTTSHPGRPLDYETLREILLDTPSSQKSEEWSDYYTHGAHLAGQNFSQVRRCHANPFSRLVLPQLTNHTTRVGSVDQAKMGGLRH